MYCYAFAFDGIDHLSKNENAIRWQSTSSRAPGAYTRGMEGSVTIPANNRPVTNLKA
jgi:hypothetical protein